MDESLKKNFLTLGDEALYMVLEDFINKFKKKNKVDVSCSEILELTVYFSSYLLAEVLEQLDVDLNKREYLFKDAMKSYCKQIEEMTRDYLKLMQKNKVTLN